MNCKPGDLAVTTHPTLTTIVTVLYAAPPANFILPDGHKALRETVGDAWVCEAMGSLLPVWCWQAGVGRRALRRYAVIPDRWLRPIRGDGLTEDTSTTVDRPQPAEA